jgi:protein-S-isoprenylcysteine O-methyltransferase Ste14
MEQDESHMVTDAIARQGNWFFRWRSYVLLAFTPLIVMAILKPEPIQTYFGATADGIYEAFCIVLAFVGLGVRIATVGFVPAGTSGRNTHSQVASTLNTTGLYSLTRNPLYLGNAITIMAVALFTQDLLLSLVMLLFLIVYLERIIATEERFLSTQFGAAYAQWTREVPAFFPRLTGWKRPALQFSLKTVLRREYSGFFAIIATFFAIDQSREVFADHVTAVDSSWLVAFLAGAAIYLLLRFLKKHTRLLHVEGR